VDELIRQTAAEAKAAATRIAGTIRETPLELSPYFSAVAGGDVYLKLENRQLTGSFKLRGATNCLLCLSGEERARGCVAASSGNHGAAVAYALRSLAMCGVIFVPEETSDAKVAAIREYGGDVRFYGTDGLDTERHARDYAERNGMYYVSPYNDPNVIAGQGTCGVEILAGLPDVDTLFVAVGGGGLLSGVGSVLKAANPALHAVACQPAASDVMARSVAAGRILALPSAATLSDGTAGGIEPDSVTFDLCRMLADEFVTVSEEEIAAAMREFAEHEGGIVEGAAGVALASLRKRPEATRGRKTALIVCGGNVSRSVADAVLQG